MRLGICLYSVDSLPIAKKVGFEYFEFPFLKIVAMSDEEFEHFHNVIHELQFFPEVIVKMFSDTQHLTGDNVDIEALRAYCKKGFERCSKIGVKGFVFGSNPARNLPDGFTDRKKAYDQLYDFLMMMSDMAEPYGYQFFIEPLMVRNFDGKTSTNILALIGEAVYMALRVNRKSVKIMVDYYHSTYNDENMQIIPLIGPLLKHIHFSTLDRKYPAAGDGGNYDEFFSMLNQAGYEGRVTIEANTPENYEEAAIIAIERLKPYM